MSHIYIYLPVFGQVAKLGWWHITEQECISAGCVPFAAVAISPTIHTPSATHPLPCMPPPPTTHGLPHAMHAPCHAHPWPWMPPLPLPLWTEFLIHLCENITFLQLLLRTVIMGKPYALLEFYIQFSVFFESRAMNIDHEIIDVFHWSRLIGYWCQLMNIWHLQLCNACIFGQFPWGWITIDRNIREWIITLVTH